MKRKPHNKWQQRCFRFTAFESVPSLLVIVTFVVFLLFGTVELSRGFLLVQLEIQTTQKTSVGEIF